MNMKKNRFERRHLTEALMKALMRGSFVIVAGALGLILWTVIARGLPSLSWSMVSQVPKGGYYMGKEGGILNAIIGSAYLASGGTLLAVLLSLPIALYLKTYLGESKWGGYVRLSLDVLWGIPSIVYGAFGFALMILFGMRASLLAGIVVLALVELPIMTRAMDEVIRRMPADLEQAALALGSTKLEVALSVVTRQMLPGIVTAILLAFGRGIGDAASVLFTAGYTDRIPTSLMRPTASLPLAVFFQLGSPYAEVRERGYAAALILTIIVLAVSFGARFLSGRLNRYTVK
ncbi:MAG: phosphate ABC transporter permease PstA [Anaerolineales bacterium]|jgi:phosphate transport system permease protein|nr:Phosphate transport system permease protein PstA [Anaerolineales bacterium]GER77982.1 phosphate ABC transporter permease PtsA [Candidatus Denitrolinea symbiosum]MCZ2290128.1 phosphate ABC transporter permease PstA [Anaerolineales bacterium]MCZ7548647.1 phosphate ABC transporter permease PstA [Anaerolineales bacterium]MDX9937233.1 phosphate ABC transporter permease PstA [Anaerolineales bacterium]